MECFLALANINADTQAARIQYHLDFGSHHADSFDPSIFNTICSLSLYSTSFVDIDIVVMLRYPK